MPEYESWIEYREIRGFPQYRIGNDGSVWTCNAPGGKGIGPWRQLKLKLKRPEGIPTVNLSLCGRSRTFKIHRLVLEAFVGPCPEGMECCHNDGDPANNHVGNLRWDTHRNNLADKVRHGTHNRGQRHPMAKLGESEVLEIRRLGAAGMSLAVISRRFGVTGDNVSLIIKRRLWKHLADKE